MTGDVIFLIIRSSAVTDGRKRQKMRQPAIKAVLQNTMSTRPPLRRCSHASKVEIHGGLIIPDSPIKQGDGRI